MHIRIKQDSVEENVRWLEVSHNGSAWSTIRIHNDDEALQIANALQQSVQSDELACDDIYHDFLLQWEEVNFCDVLS